MQRIQNMELYEDRIVITINPLIYPLDIVYSAAYTLLDRAYILIEGNPSEEIIVELNPKKGEQLLDLGREFNNQLLNYVVYKTQSEKAAPIKEAIIKQALK